MSKALVSIIIPVYNAEKYLAKCIESVLSQTFIDFELILINDGSTDSSQSICNKFSLVDERVKNYSQENGGVSSARNLGLKNANGTWVCFVDSDDIIKEGFLESFIMSSELSESQLIIQDIIKENFITKDQTLITAYSYGKFYLKDLGKHLGNNDIYLLGFAVCKFYNLDLIKKENLLFNINIKYFEDLLFYLNYLKHIEAIHFIDQAHYIYNIHDESARSKTYTFEHYIGVIDEMSKSLKELLKVEKWDSFYQIKDMLGMFHFLALLAVFKKKNNYTYKERISRLAVLTNKKFFRYIEDYIARRRTKYIELLFINMLKANKIKTVQLVMGPYLRIYDYFLKFKY